MDDSSRVSSLTLWDEFSGSVDDAVFDYNFAAHRTVWQMEVLSDHLRVFSTEDPALAADVEFFRGLRRIVVLFSPSGIMHVYDFGSGRPLASDLGPNARPANPGTLGGHLLELIPDPKP
ncbi:MAG: hypothetical protein KGN36_12465 [Acidobacteriota bacterium]|nr:hypothetical protein [Acidobacteriota bacterium]